MKLSSKLHPCPVNKYGKPIYVERQMNGKDELDNLEKYLIAYKIKHTIFKLKDKNDNNITAIVCANDGLFQLNVFNSSNEKIESVDPSDICDYEFNKKYDVATVKNCLINLGII